MIVGFDRPGADRKAELNVCFDLASVESGVKESELYGSFGEECVEVKSVIAGVVVMRMVDPAYISVIGFGVPDLLQSCPGDVSLGLHCLVELLAD